MTRYLLHPSAFRQARIDPTSAHRIRELSQAERLVASTPAILAMLAGARTHTEWDAMRTALDGLPHLDIANPTAAIDLHGVLARQGRHRIATTDLLIVSAAAEHGLTVLHADPDISRLLDGAGGSHEWVVAP